METSLDIADRAQLERFGERFVGCTLPRELWTHHAHLVVGLWHLLHHTPQEALGLMRSRIWAYNEAVGTANTDRGGYHETLTRFFLIALEAFLRSKGEQRADIPALLAALARSSLTNKDLPLAFYSRERLFSVEARRAWVEPDLRSLDSFAVANENRGGWRGRSDGK